MGNPQSKVTVGMGEEGANVLSPDNKQDYKLQRPHFGVDHFTDRVPRASSFKITHFLEVMEPH